MYGSRVIARMSGGRVTAEQVTALGGQAVRFGGVGLAGFALDYTVLSATIAAGASPYAGRVLSIAASITLTWALNRRVTFRAQRPPSWREFAAYTAQALLGATLNYLIYAGGIWAGLPIIVALVLGTGAVAAFNFIRYRALLK